VSVSDWIALGALAVASVGPTLTQLRGAARREGKIDAVLEELKKITADHEDRLRNGKL
jgi:hypothetical protein